MRRNGRSRAPVPAYREPPAQLVIAQGVEDVLTRGGALEGEAGTGTGKSLGYLGSSALSGRRVIVSTATLALHEQLLRDNLPLASAARGKGNPRRSCSRGT